MITAAKPQEPELSSAEQMTRLCLRIRTVANCPGVSPWNARKFAAAQHGRSQSEKIAASFVLLVWTQDQNHSQWSDVPPFDLSEAAAHCDVVVKAAIAQWLLDPFWP